MFNAIHGSKTISGIYDTNILKFQMRPLLFNKVFLYIYSEYPQL